MKENLDIICQYNAGSHSHGLNTPESDIDCRGVYALRSPDQIINPYSRLTDGLETEVTVDPDTAYYEFRHFLNLLYKGNPSMLEVLFNKNWTKITPLFKEVQDSARNLINPEKVRDCIEGYAMSEYQLAIGTRTGKLGGKRSETIRKLGFSPKNFVNLFRLLYGAEVFFETKVFPVNISGTYIHPQLMELKTSPERFSKKRLIDMFDEKMKSMFDSWEKNKRSVCSYYVYNSNVATRLILKCYIDRLDSAIHSKLKYNLSRLIP